MTVTLDCKKEESPTLVFLAHSIDGMKRIASKHVCSVSSLWIKTFLNRGVVRLNDMAGEPCDVAAVPKDDKLLLLGERVMVLSIGVSNVEIEVESHLVSGSVYT